MTSVPQISVIIPTFNAANQLGGCLAALVPAASEGIIRDVIIVDAGSNDATRDIAEGMGAKWRQADKGRGTQLGAGAQIAKSDWLLFLHADSWLINPWFDAAMRHMMARPEAAAYFQLQYRSNAPQARWLEARANRRAHWFALPYGDQGLLISVKLYQDIGGYAPIPLMEDVDIAKRLGRQRLTPLGATITTSADKYERDGWRKRAYTNAWTLGRYLMGAKPEALAKVYT